MTLRRPTSIAGLLIVLIVTTVSVLLAAVGALAYRAYSVAEHGEFERSIELAADQLAVGLAPAAWNLEYEQVRKLMESRMRDRSIYGVVVQLDTARFALQRNEDWELQSVDGDIDSTGLFVTEQPVSFGEQRIGQVRVIGSPRFVDQDLRSALATMVLFTVLLDVVLTLALYIALQRMVLQPLRLVERHADEVARHGRSTTALGDLSFLGELQRLTQSVDAMVTQLEARNAELERSNERFRRVIRLLPLPISLFDRDGRILYVNDCFVDTFGYTLEDIPDAHTWFGLAYPDPAYRAEVLQTWGQELASAQGTSGLVRARPYVVTCKDGSRKIVEIGGMLADDPNITVLNDITDRTRAEEELARHRDHLEELVSSRTAELEAANRRLEETQFALDHAGVAIQWIDAASGCFSYVNDHACTLYGYPRERLLGMPAHSVIDDFTGARLSALEPALRAQGQARIEADARRGDGRVVPVEIGIYFDPLADGGAAHYIAFSIDITPRREAEQALIAARLAAESAAQARSEFLANMSHEIRTPMNAVIGMTRLALQTELTARQRNFVSKANASAVALLGILNDILDFSKVEAGQITIESVPFRLDRVFESLLSVVSLRAEEKGLDLLFDVAPDVPPVLVGDPLRMGQILTNLAGNAIKFTERGEVLVSCRVIARDSQHATLAFGVRDTGIGMSADQLGGLFRPFMQGDTSISRRFGGTGLGLAISRRLAELMGGTLSAHSVEGQGSTFTFTARFETGELPDSALRTLPSALHKRRVLVVDDNPEALQILCRDLEHLGLSTERAQSGPQAIELLRSRPPFALLVCDWKMPGMDGIELIRRVQSCDDLAHPPAVVMVSAYGADDLQHAGAGLAIAGVLTKPASTSSLYDAIVSALGHQVAAEGSSGDAPGSFRSDALRGRRVLLVEDNPINQELGVEILTGAGVRVTVAENGAEALRRLDAEEFDCVLMDVQMPVMDGLEATREIRRRERLNKLPVIAMTAGAMPWEREQTRAAGMDDHVTKPVDVDELLRTLTRWLGSVPPEEPAADSSAPIADATPLLDTAAALRSMNGASATYRRVLGMFLDSADAAQTQLKQAWGDRDFDTLGQLAHRHKGSAATLGARALSTALDAVEMACRAGDPAVIDAAMTDSTPVFAATVEAMRVQADAGSLAPPSATELDTLHALLSSNDSDAQEAIARLLARAQPADILPVLRQMSRAMERYDFDAALLQLAQLRTTIAAGAADASGVEGQI